MRRDILFFPIRTFVFFLGASLFSHPGLLHAQRMPTNAPAILAGKIVVRVQEGTGSPFGSLATVTLRSIDMTTNLANSTNEAGETSFSGLSVGDYLVEVSASGYQTVRQQAVIAATREVEDILVAMVPDTGDSMSRAPQGRGKMASKALKETERSLHALQHGSLDEAQEHLKRALTFSPGFPDANYLMGVLCLRRGDPAQARVYLQKTVELAPRHAAALLALGEAQVLQQDYPRAIASLERSIDLRPAMWRAQWLVGLAYYQQRDYKQALDHAQAALLTGQDKTGSSRLLLGEAQAGLDERQAATASLEQFLREQPRNPQAATARQILDRLRRSNGSAVDAAAITTTTSAAIIPALEMPADPSAPAPAPAPAPSPQPGLPALPAMPLLAPVVETNWAPPDIDEEKPALESGASCHLDQVNLAAGARVQELVRNVDRFTATERLEHTNLSPLGVQISKETRSFDYLVEIRQTGSHALDVQEYRNGSVSAQEFPAHIGTIGLPTLALVFHPYNQDKYEFACEGRGAWRGRPVWVVHFQQRTDHTSEMLVYRVGGKFFAVGLKGRAWIDEQSFQILAMESDLMHPIPQIRLFRDHQLIEYGPVEFRNATTRLWLPKSADWYCHLSGQRYHRRHTFSHFLLFSVDDSQKISKPEETLEKSPPQL